MISSCFKSLYTVAAAFSFFRYSAAILTYSLVIYALGQADGKKLFPGVGNISLIPEVLFAEFDPIHADDPGDIIHVALCCPDELLMSEVSVGTGSFLQLTA